MVCQMSYALIVELDFGKGGSKAYMKLKNEYESHRLPNGRFGGW
jgi:hypothetical protein